MQDEKKVENKAAVGAERSALAQPSGTPPPPQVGEMIHVYIQCTSPIEIAPNQIYEDGQAYLVDERTYRRLEARHGSNVRIVRLPSHLGKKLV